MCEVNNTTENEVVKEVTAEATVADVNVVNANGRSISEEALNKAVTEDTPEEVVEEKTEFIVDFTMSYSQFIKAKEATELTQEETEMLVDNMITYYQMEAPVEEVKNFFDAINIDDDVIASRKYTVSGEVVSDDKTYQILYIRYTLKINPDNDDKTVIEEVPVENIVDTEATEIPVEENLEV